MGCPSAFNLRGALEDKLRGRHVSYFDMKEDAPGVDTGADVIFDFQKRRDWIARNIKVDGPDTPLAQLQANPDSNPIVGILKLCFNDKDNQARLVCHLISYIMRRTPAGYELILLEPYNTDVFRNRDNIGGGTWGLTRDWRESITRYLRVLFGLETLKLSAPMAGQKLVYYNLGKKDAGEGQCASWAIRMIEKVSTLNLKTATPAEMFEAIRTLQAGGRYRKTRRSKRTKTRGTRHARVR